ncbi:MAG: helix-turn-helix domain-containing protein [Gemmatimonadota bacterium]
MTSAMDYEHAGPAVLRMLVGMQLRRLREEHRISCEEAGQSIRASRSKISRMEHGRVALKPRDVADLLSLYGVSDPAEIDAVLTLARRASAPGWWRAFTDVVPAWFEPYLGLEQGASVIRSYDIHCVPALLQTPDYARAVIRLAQERASLPQVEQFVRFRMRRQEILRRPGPARLWAVIDEDVLRRPVGSRAIMRAQLEHLQEAAALPNVTIQVLPGTAPASAAVAGPITILRFPEWHLPDVVYLEQLTCGSYPDRPADVERCWDAMNRLVTQAHPPEVTTGILRQLLSGT